jgi:hypothetical protein
VISSQADLQPGGLVFFGGGSLANAEYVGVYAGGGEMWDANDYNVPVQERRGHIPELPGIRRRRGRRQFRRHRARNVDNGFFFLKDGPAFNDQTSYQWAADTNYQVFAGDFNADNAGDIGLRDIDHPWAAG